MKRLNFKECCLLILVAGLFFLLPAKAEEAAVEAVPAQETVAPAVQDVATNEQSADAGAAEVSQPDQPEAQTEDGAGGQDAGDDSDETVADEAEAAEPQITADTPADEPADEPAPDIDDEQAKDEIADEEIVTDEQDEETPEDTAAPTPVISSKLSATITTTTTDTDSTSSSHDNTTASTTPSPQLSSQSLNAEKLQAPTINAEQATTSPAVSSTTLPTVNFHLRYQDRLIFQDSLELVTSTLITYHDSSTSTLTSSTLSQPSVLSALALADQASDDFTISDLVYYSSWNSYYLNCLEIGTTTACYNWQYVVDDQYPIVGMDNYTLSGGEDIYVYYGTPNKITASTSTFPINTSTILQAWRYDYDNLEQEWTIDPNVSIEIFVNNPNSISWDDTTINVTTTLSDDSGQLAYKFDATGTYYAKIISADWSKWSNPITLTVEKETASNTSTTDQNNAGGGEQTPDNEPETQDVSDGQIQTAVDKLVDYLKSQQDNTGKIVDAGITDWSIMSLVAAGLNPAEIKKQDKTLLDFALDYEFTDASDLNLCAAYPRHLLSLYTAGLPLSDTAVQNLISKIKTDCYQDNDYGQAGINDDIFALLSLLAAGENTSQPIIQNLISEILADQQTDGSFTWDGYPGADITGAAINALLYAQNKGVEIDDQTVDQARQYLKNSQGDDGGWGWGSADVLTTSWVMMGINSLQETQTLWYEQDKNPWHVLTDNLNEDGYYESSWSPGTVDWFAVKHAIPALLGESWPIEPVFRQSSTDQPTDQTVEQEEGEEEEEIIDEEIVTPTSTLLTPTSTLIASTTLQDNLTTTTWKNSSSTPNTPSSTTAIAKSPAPDHTTENGYAFTSGAPAEPAGPTPFQQEINDMTSSSKTILTSGPEEKKLEAEKIIDSLPLDTPTRRAAKKALAVSGGGALALGLYLGLKLLRNVI